MFEINCVIDGLMIFKKYVGKNLTPLDSAGEDVLSIELSIDVSDKDYVKLDKLGWQREKEDSKIWFW